MATIAQTNGSSYQSGHNGFGASGSESSQSPSLFGRLLGKSNGDKKGSDEDAKKPEPKRRGPKPDSKPAKDRRQELNRQAQRSHRERREKQMKNLEEQVLNLKDLYEETARERNLVQEENRRLKELLAARNIPYASDKPIVKHETSSSDSFFGSFRTPSSSSMTHSPSSSETHDRSRQLRLPPSGFDYSAAMDFVLALEKDCTQHLQLLYNLSRQHSEAVNLDEDESESRPPDFGHALMFSCPPGHHLRKMNDPMQPDLSKLPDLPPADLWTLLEKSAHLDGKSENEMTPVEALAALVNDERFPLLTAADFQCVQDILQKKVRCFGFGAELEHFEVYDAIENVLASRMEQ